MNCSSSPDYLSIVTINKKDNLKIDSIDNIYHYILKETLK